MHDQFTFDDILHMQFIETDFLNCEKIRSAIYEFIKDNFYNTTIEMIYIQNAAVNIRVGFTYGNYRNISLSC